MDNVQHALSELGLTRTEITIYLAGLRQDSIGVQALVRQTHIKRPTVYHALETLLQKGLVSKHGTARSQLFHMTPPERLQSLLDEQILRLNGQKETLKLVLPLLQQRIGSSSSNEIRVTKYEGIEGIKTVVEEALYCRSAHWNILAPRQNFFSQFDKAYATYFIGTRKQRNISARSLWEYGTAEIDRPLTPAEVRFRNPRYLPKNMHGAFESVVILFDQKVAIISSLESLSAILIDSAEIHRLMLAMFEGLWLVSEPYAKNVDKK